MERLFMGPRRGDDRSGDPLVEGAAERVDLGERSGTSEDPAVAPHDAAAASVRPAEHWLAGLVRADVLALSAAGVVLLAAVGLPFLGMMQNLALYVGPLEASTAWAFAPPLVAGGLATLLGLAGLRQAARHGAPGWVRAVAGAATLLGCLIAAGSAVTWLYAADSGVFGPDAQS